MTNALIPWRCGRWHMLVDAERGALFDLRHGKRSLLDQVFAMARHADWSNVPWRLVKQSREERVWTFAFEGGQMRADLSYTVHNQEELVVELSVQAQQPVLVNRVGLCLLHALGQRDFTTQRADECPKQGSFPGQEIAPWPIASDFTRWSGEGWSYEMEGAVLEIEDQRNWGDASFKTYTGLVSDIMPYLFDAEVSQRLRIRVEPREAPLELGLSLPISVPPWLADRLAPLKLHHLLLHLRAGENWSLALQEAGQLTRRLGCRLHVIAEFSEAGEMLEGVDLLGVSEVGKTVPSATLLSSFPSDSVAIVYSGHVVDGIRGGWQLASQCKAVMLAYHPQAHLMDESSILQNVEGAAVVASAVPNELPLHLAPLTLSPASLPEARQSSDFGAEWLAQVLGALEQVGRPLTVSVVHTHGVGGAFDALGEPTALGRMLSQWLSK
jgi:hypothetical protein